MQNFGPSFSSYGLDRLGIRNGGTVYWNLPTPMLYEEAIRRREAVISHQGPLVVRTGDHTGRAPNDKFIVKEPISEGHIWWGSHNRPFSEERFNSLLLKVNAYLQNRDIFVMDAYAGADARFRMPIRVVSESAWHSLFARNIFIRELDRKHLSEFVPEFTVLHVPGFHADPEVDGTNSQTFIVMNFAQRLVLVGGTAYAGEIKKSIFTAMNYYLPLRDVLTMHCSANYGKTRDDVALFFGLSGTGKTTLSADPERTLIGDDEHGWSNKGVFNIEGGCYAKVIRLDPQGEPEIFKTTRRFGTVLENVAYDGDTRHLDLDSDALTENTRACYPITHIDNADPEGIGGHPKDIIFLTADAFGVLPPIARLTREQAMYYFISGYTAKVAGTEVGVKEPKATFSACFGAPFMPLDPGAYAKLLGERIDEHKARVWLVNTGWTGGPYGEGSRFKLSYTRRIVAAALSGELDGVATRIDPFFGLEVPTKIEGVPEEVLDPRRTWKEESRYDEYARKLAGMFKENFRQFHGMVDASVTASGPR